MVYLITTEVLQRHELEIQGFQQNTPRVTGAEVDSKGQRGGDEVREGKVGAGYKSSNVFFLCCYVAFLIFLQVMYINWFNKSRKNK